MCITQGFPAVPFFVDEDLTRADGVIRCREISNVELAQLSWRMLRLLQMLGRIPIAF